MLHRSSTAVAMAANAAGSGMVEARRVLGILAAGEAASAGSAVMPPTVAGAAQPGGARPDTVSAGGESIDWDAIVGCQNAKLALVSSAVIPAGAPIAKPASTGNMWDSIVIDLNADLAKREPRAVIPGGGR